MTHSMEEKIKLLDSYISKLDKAVAEKDSESAKRLQTEVISVYDSEIDGLKNELDNYSIAIFANTRNPDFIGDAQLLSAILTNYKVNLASGLYKVFQNADGAVNVTQSVQQEILNNIAVTIEQAIYDINVLPDTVLTDDDKEILVGKIATLSSMKDKESKLDKAKEILKWIANKSVDVGIAALPYVVQAIKSTSI